MIYMDTNPARLGAGVMTYFLSTNRSEWSFLDTGCTNGARLNELAKSWPCRSQLRNLVKGFTESLSIIH